jgi:membrane-associated phospholipid phosphatase
MVDGERDTMLAAGQDSGEASGDLRAGADGVIGAAGSRLGIDAATRAIADGIAGRLPLNRLCAGYMLASAVALGFPKHSRGWPLALATHIGAGLLVLGLPPFQRVVPAVRRRWPALQGFLADWYPLLLIPLLYGELEPLNKAIHGGRYFDDLILGWEEILFGGQPSQALAAVMPSLPLSETLHAAYLSYYFIIFGPPLFLYLTGRREAFRQTAFTVMLVFFLHYLFFIYFPVQGPRYLFPAPDGVVATGFFYQLAHRILESGSSQGAAFPSSHVGVAFAQAALAVRFLPRLAPSLFVAATALAIGAIYGGFHYATDAVAGLVLGLAGVAIAGPLRRRLA